MLKVNKLPYESGNVKSKSEQCGRNIESESEQLVI